MSEIIETYQQEQKQLGKPELPQTAFATVVSVNDDGLELQFDGEDEASTKRFPYNVGVSFEVDQRALLMKVNGSYIALCPVGPQGGGGGGGGGGGSWSDFLPIGGTIFRDNGVNGAEYAFFDAQKNQIYDTSILSLANAAFYKIKGTFSAARWCLYYPDALCTGKPWGGSEINYGATSDLGANNTATVLNSYTTALQGSIWEWLKELRAQNFGGFSDWFFPSAVEARSLFNSDLIPASTFIWTSNEINRIDARTINKTSSGQHVKTTIHNAYAVRAI